MPRKKTNKKNFSLPPHANAEVHKKIMENLRVMTDEEFFQTLVAAGIYNSDGTLRPEYCSPKNKSAKKRKNK